MTPLRAARPRAVRARLRLRPARRGARLAAGRRRRPRRRAAARRGQGAARPATCRSASSRCRRSGVYLERARPQLVAAGAAAAAGASDARSERALFLSKSGRRARHERRRRRLRVWTERAGDRPGRVSPARPAPQLRDPSARRRRRPAQHPGAARPRERLDHAGLHSGRVREAQKRVCAQPPSGLRSGRKILETNVKPIELRELWRRYKSDGDRRARERLVVAYSPLVKYVAGRTAAGLPPHVEEADLISYGLVGPDLRDRALRSSAARSSSRPTRSRASRARSSTSCARWTGCRAACAPARARSSARNSKLEHSLQRAPTDEELAAELGLTVDELQDSLLAISHSSIVALDELWSVSDSSGDQVSLMDTIEDPGAPDPARALDVGDMKDRIAESIAQLPEREKLVIALYYYENLTLREIGEVLGVTESRVSQLHTKAVLRLRSRMQGETLTTDARGLVRIWRRRCASSMVVDSAERRYACARASGSDSQRRPRRPSRRRARPRCTRRCCSRPA